MRHRELLLGHRLIRRLKALVDELGLDRRDFVIFGSGPLLAHGLRDDVQDLDIVARNATWERVRREGVPGTGSVNGAEVAQFWAGDGWIQFSSGWISPRWQADQLIDEAETIHGLPFARLEDVLAYKRELGRSKDRPDIAALERRSRAG